MNSIQKAAVAIVAMLVLSAVGAFALGSVLSDESVSDESGNAVPEQQSYSSDADASAQVEAVLSQLYYVDHRQDVSAEMRSVNNDIPMREIESVTLVSHSSEQLFSGTQVENSDGSAAVQFRYVDSSTGGVADGTRGAVLTEPPLDGWERTEARYDQQSSVPGISAEAEWTVGSANESTVVLRVDGETEYMNAQGSSAFDELTAESYVELYVDVESGELVKVVDRQVGLIEEDDGSVRGPIVFHRELVFEYGAVDIERPSALDG